MRLGWITTFNVKCGLATYSKHMLESLGMLHEAVIFAEYSNNLVKQEQNNVIRCWYRHDDLSQLFNQVISNKIEVLVFQYHAGLFNSNAINNFIQQIKLNNIKLIFMIHSVPPASTYFPSLKLCDYVTVQIEKDYHFVSNNFNIKENLIVHYHGINYKSKTENNNLISDRQFPLIGCFGFCLPNKGIIELLQATVLLRNNNFICNLSLNNSQHTDSSSIHYINECRNFIVRNNLQNQVTFRNEFLSDEDAEGFLKECDFLINPYQKTNEPVSGSVRHLLATGLPVAITPSSIFDDIKQVAYLMRGMSPENIAQSIPEIWNSIKSKDKLYQEINYKAVKWREENSYDTLAKKFLLLLEK